mmetsp:Transcript_10033/g.11284  ORF Transcript_10033/g.11284 Transcript_10033/m.11284 type:complete len:207 (-) Transcript_10033:559-1179(-)
MNDYEHLLATIKERIVKNGTAGNFDVVSDICKEMVQFQINVSNKLLSEETFLIMLKQRVSERIHGPSQDVPKALPEENIEVKVEESLRVVTSEVFRIEANHEIKLEESVEKETEEVVEMTPEEIVEIQSEELKVTKTEITVQELKALADEIRGVKSKGRNIVGKEVLDLDLAQSWTAKFIQKVAEKYILPKSITRINIYSLDEENE